MNDLQQEFKGKGLVVIGVTSDMNKEATLKWCQETGTRYAWGYDVGGKIQNKLGVRGIPHATLLSPGGKVLYNGHPAGLDHELVAEATKDAIQKPLWSNKAAGDVLAALRKNELGKALVAASKLGKENEGEKIHGYVKRKVEAVVYGLFELHKQGDFLACHEGAEKAANSLAGTPDVDLVHQLIEDLAQDKEAQRIIEGQKELRTLMDRYKKLRSKADAKVVLQDLEAIIGRFPDTIISRQANKSADALAKRLKVERKK